MKCLLSIAMLVFFFTISEAQTSDVGHLARVSITDRDTGAVLVPYRYHGDYWVAGRPGARYAIEIRNDLGERLLAVTSVDGVNVVSGDTAAWDQTGFVFRPNEAYQITGWRKSDSVVAAFTFTDSSRSYAERTGRPVNVGVIGIALFRERAPQVVSAPFARGQPDAATPDGGAPQGGVAAAAAPVPMDGFKNGSDARANGALASSESYAPPTKLGTGHGEREYSYAARTDFVRSQTRPNEIIRIRYDSFENLWAMGIIPRGRTTPSGANPFPASPRPSYVPDPAG